ncbi:MAG: YbaB/EbfC family nucleoid-associated protein [Candidatus Falkowbacteria bacterium]|nr:YbaB/EbfC family nucleoid-associated protein [Candidatus Falkowbacteria bacterium]
MFEKLKQIKDLRTQAKTMQNALSGESVTVEKNGLTITINGNLEVTAFTVAENMSQSQIANSAKDAINEAIKKVQKIMAQKMQDMGGLKNFGL